jgi:hypothetical protein
MLHLSSVPEFEDHSFAHVSVRRAFATTLKISACQSFLHGVTPVFGNRQNTTKYNPKHELTGRKQRSS